MSDPQGRVRTGRMVHRRMSIMHVAIHRDGAVTSQLQQAVPDRCLMISPQTLEVSDEDAQPVGHVAEPGWHR